MAERTPLPAASTAAAAALETQVQRAQGGDRAALEAVVAAIQRDVYGLALRFLWHPQDAEDAAQEILIRVVTHLGSFRGESAFRTWVWRIAANTLLNLRRARMEQATVSFDAFGRDLEQGLSDAPLSVPAGVEEALLLEEVKIGCSLGMLLCLERPQRLAYILGEILELDHAEAAAVLEVRPAAFRQRLARARRAVSDFMLARCGLINPANPCRCRRRVNTAIALGRVNPQRLLHAGSLQRARAFPETLSEIRRLEETRRAVALYRSHPTPGEGFDFTAAVRRLLEAHP
jgi:RNA polymerase sigma factor (sigma-70 family)